jgi:hypothetical protein
MAKETAQDVLDVAFEKIARSLEDQGAAYADLAGNVYDKKTYMERLKVDPEFAKQQIATFIQPPAAESDEITPREQRTLARRFAKFADSHTPDVAEFLRANPMISETYTVGDLRRVLETVKFEMDIQAIVPGKIDDADENATLATLIEG